MKNQINERATWPFARYRFRLRVVESLRLPEYGGSKIRGIFGRMLRRVACMTKRRNCQECPLKTTCPYTTIFETASPVEHQLQSFSQTPHGYIVEAPLDGARTYSAGEILEFDLVLVGKVRFLLALIVYTIEKSFERGIGYGRAQLKEVLYQGASGFETVYFPGGDGIKDHDAALCLKGITPPSDGSLQLEFQTTLRIQHFGRLLDAQSMDARTFLVALTRRIGLLMEFFDERLDLDYEMISGLASRASMEVDGQWSHWKRYSTRQKRLMDLAGVKGLVTFHNVDPFFYPFLELGTFSHVGKNASFGLGKYIIKNPI